MNVAVVVATCGDDCWRECAAERAVPSAFAEATAGPGRTVHVSHYPGLTVAEARNRAADEVPRGSDWLCFLDADDELEPGYLDAMMRANGGRVWLTPKSPEAIRAPLLVPLLRRVPPEESQPPWRTARTLADIPNRGRWPHLNECVIGTLVHRALFEQVGGFRTEADDGTPISIYEDWDLWLRCVDAGAARVYVEDAVYRAHVNPGGGRNYSPDPQPVYDAIWNDHMARTT